MRLTFALLCALALAAFAAPSRAINTYDYFNLPNRRQLEQSETAQNIVDALEKLYLKHDERSASIMERVQQKLKSDTDLSATTRKVYEQLVALGDSKDHCPRELIEQTKLIVALIKFNEKTAIRLRRFLRRFGNGKFDSCVKRQQDNLELHLGLHVEESLDECLVAAVKSGPAEREDHLGKLELFRELDLAESKVNLARMARRAVEYATPTGQDSTLVVNFLQWKCSKLDEMLADLFDQLNLARLFEADETPYRKRLLKLNEVWRLCLSVNGPRERLAKVEANLKKAEASGGLWAKLSCKTADCA